jgi:nitrilase
VISVSSLMRKRDSPENKPHLDKILEKAPNVLANGGSCISGLDCEWITAPILNK